MESITQPTSQRFQVSLSRGLGLFDVTMIGVGAMIGAGIFGLTGIAAGVAVAQSTNGPGPGGGETAGHVGAGTAYFRVLSLRSRSLPH